MAAAFTTRKTLEIVSVGCHVKSSFLKAGACWFEGFAWIGKGSLIDVAVYSQRFRFESGNYFIKKKSST